MRYTYAYKTSDGTRHEDAMDAASREAVFESLRARGIKAIKVVAADGSKANGEVKQGSARIWKWVAVALLVLMSLVFYLYRSSRSSHPSATPRHQIYGDPALMEELYESGFAGVFEDMTDRYIAYFAQPGIMPDERLLAKLRPFVLAGTANEHSSGGLDRSVESSREVGELRDIVLGMRQEMREFLADGTSMAEYLNALSERQQEENDIYERVAAELDGEKDESVRERKNAALRTLGLKTVPRPRKTM